MMFFWIYAIIFVALITIVILFATTRKVTNKPLDDEAFATKNNVALYKKQLQEIETDFQQGFIDKKSAEEARVESARYILAKETHLKKDTIKPPKNILKRSVLAVAVLMVFILPLTLYTYIGKPNTPSQPFQLLLDKPAEMRSEEEKLVAMEALFMRRPNDGKIADQLASQYLIAGQFRNAANSYIDALRLNGENAPRLVGYGLALIGLDGGVISKDAQNAFEQAAKIAPDDYYPQIFIARALEQAGQNEKAIQGLEYFLQKMPKDKGENDQWRIKIEEMIKQLQN